MGNIRHYHNLSSKDDTINIIDIYVYNWSFIIILFLFRISILYVTLMNVEIQFKHFKLLSWSPGKGFFPWKHQLIEVVVDKGLEISHFKMNRYLFQAK